MAIDACSGMMLVSAGSSTWSAGVRRTPPAGSRPPARLRGSPHPGAFASPVDSRQMEGVMRGWKILSLAVLGFLLPAHAWAQAAGSIAGAVRDASGGVLPGVTVEVASPALIEKVRTAVTDGEGQY